MTDLNPIAAYGALLSTAVAAWNAYQWWRSGAWLKGRVSANMIGYGHMANLDSTYLMIVVSNRGKAETTVTHVSTERYKSWLDYILKRRAQKTVVTGDLPQYRLPFRLGPGHEFVSVMQQDREVEDWSRKYRFYVGIFHSMSDQPFRIRVPVIAAAHE